MASPSSSSPDATASDVTVRLRDGRRIGVASVGPSDGFPIIHCHGSGSSRLEVLLLAFEATAAGVHLIGLDRPGVGCSDPQPGYRLLDWPADVAEVAGKLGLARFAVEGMSAGGPFALACAYGIPDRLTACGLVSTISTPEFIRKAGPASMRAIGWIGERFPRLLLRYARLVQRLTGSDAASTERYLIRYAPRRSLLGRCTRSVVGLAAWQQYWATLDFFLLPGPEMPATEAALFAWVDERFRERDAERGHALPYPVEFRDDDTARKRMVEAHGFVLDEVDRYVLLEHQLDAVTPVPALPDGFALRPLQGEQEAEAYAELHRAAFQSASMTTEWRRHVIRAPQYRPELDLVVSAPDGLLAGFCVGWYEPARRLAQIEPFGVYPHFQQLGLGRILLLAMLQRFKEQGATAAMVETGVQNAAARRAYASAGFKQTHTIRSTEKLVSP